jgi:hypothetical protein
MAPMIVVPRDILSAGFDVTPEACSSTTQAIDWQGRTPTLISGTVPDNDRITIRREQDG